MIINLAKIRFGSGASAKPEDSFQETYTANGSYDITPEKGHVFSGGHVEVDVHPTDKLTRTYTENSTYEISGEWTNAEITVAVPGPVEETFDITPTNSDITVVPTVADNVFSGGVVRGYDVDPIYNALDDLNTGDPVPPVTPFVVPEGIKFAYSSVTSFPNNWIWSQATDLSNMFSYCSSLTSIPQLDTSNVTGMNSMFLACSSLTSIPQMDTSRVTDMNYMFYNCTSLTSIPRMDTSKVRYMDSMFNTCWSLTEINITAIPKTNIYDFITGCTALPRTEIVKLLELLPQLDSGESYRFGIGDQLSKLTDEDIAIGTAKGWQIVS